MLVTKILNENKRDEFGVVDSLEVLRNQITSRLNQLENLMRYEQMEKKANLTKNSSKGSSSKTNNISTKPLIENASLQLFHSTIAELETSLLKNLNIRANEVPNNIKSYKVPLINKTEINQIEHSLQLLNFKGSDDLKLRNDYLTKLNTLYYSEMLADQEVIKDVVTVIKDVESGMENNKKWTKINQITDESAFNIIDELQKKISNLEREKLHMENEIIKLKERWNNLVEGARRRKEQEKEFQASRVETSPAIIEHEYDNYNLNKNK